MSPYGETKLVGEWMVRAAASAHGLRGTLLRYFNVAGAPDEPLLADVEVLIACSPATPATPTTSAPAAEPA